MPAHPAPESIKLSTAARSGMLDGEDREVLAERETAGMPDPVAAAEKRAKIAYQQDRSLALAGWPPDQAGTASPAARLGDTLDLLAREHGGNESSAAIAMAHVHTTEATNGKDKTRQLHIDAASIGDCDVYIAIRNGKGQTSVRRLFDPDDFPQVIDEAGTAMRKFAECIGGQGDPQQRQHQLAIPLKPDDTAVVFTASDGFWDGYAALPGHDSDTTRDEPISAKTRRMKSEIAASVGRELEQHGGTHIAEGLVNELLERSRTSSLPHTDNLSATALVISGSGPAPAPTVIGSIDGSGKIGPAEQMLAAMQRDIRQQLGPSLLAPEQAPATALSDWRGRRGDQRMPATAPARPLAAP